jgi:hypothetical protein
MREIERGRYTRIKKENRICKFCDLKEVEDELRHSKNVQIK